MWTVGCRRPGANGDPKLCASDLAGLGVLLAFSRRIETLDLRGNELFGAAGPSDSSEVLARASGAAEGLRRFAVGIALNSSLRHLLLDRNPSLGTVDTFEAFVAALEDARLETLSLDRTWLLGVDEYGRGDRSEPDRWRRFCGAIGAMPRLGTLSVAENCVDPEALLDLASPCATNPSLRTLRLGVLQYDFGPGGGGNRLAGFDRSSNGHHGGARRWC